MYLLRRCLLIRAGGSALLMAWLRWGALGGAGAAGAVARLPAVQSTDVGVDLYRLYHAASCLLLWQRCALLLALQCL
jgi:hypothetical protein